VDGNCWYHTPSLILVLDRLASKPLLLNKESPGNYDYQTDTIFHPSGSIELEVRASGFLLARYFDESSNGQYGKLHAISPSAEER
jgi:Cu2+-containing amine oxidase